MNESMPQVGVTDLADETQSGLPPRGVVGSHTLSVLWPGVSGLGDPAGDLPPPSR